VFAADPDSRQTGTIDRNGVSYFCLVHKKIRLDTQLAALI
jgi:hypothetical protein